MQNSTKNECYGDKLKCQ